MEYILYCDESSDKGPKFGDFFGGCLVSSTHLTEVVNDLESTKRTLNLQGEIKWTKVTEPYLDKYKEIMSVFFKHVADDKIKVRIMFRPTKDGPPVTANYNPDDKYFKLYYQFIKHSFGFMSLTSAESPIFVRIYLDQLPDKREKCANFKNYIQYMPDSKDFADSSIQIRAGDIAEICSHDHVLLQCVDIILGAMYFRLNDLHKAIPEGQKRRGKRTVAKENLYKHINRLICDMLPNFNIGVSTGDHGYCNPHWSCPYQHWKFESKK